MRDSDRFREALQKPAQSSVSLGFDLMSLDLKARQARVRFAGRADFTNPAGYVQGGYLVAMMDDALGMLAASVAGSGRLPSTVDLNAHFLRPVRPGRVEVLARIRNVGRVMMFAEAELFDSRGKEAARATASLTLNPVKASREQVSRHRPRSSCAPRHPLLTVAGRDIFDPQSSCPTVTPKGGPPRQAHLAGRGQFIHRPRPLLSEPKGASHA